MGSDPVAGRLDVEAVVGQLKALGFPEAYVKNFVGLDSGFKFGEIAGPAPAPRPETEPRSALFEAGDYLPEVADDIVCSAVISYLYRYHATNL